MTHPTSTRPPLALVTGASRGLGAALARSLAAAGWRLILTARSADDLQRLAAELPDGSPPGALVLHGDVAEPAHRRSLAAAVAARGGTLTALINNASTLGPSPLPAVAAVDLDALRRIHDVNVLAPVGLTQLLLPALRDGAGAVVNISSDAAVGHWPGWGPYGASKAALDHLTAVLAVEESRLDVYAVDPGDMRTAMHQAAFPGTDISDRPAPETVVPAVLRLLDERPPSGRYRAADILAAEVVA